MTGVTERTIQEWAKQKVLKKVSHGKYNLRSSLQTALERDVFQGGTSNNEVTTEEIQQNKALLEKARADLAETEVGIEKRKLVDLGDVKGYVNNQMVLFKKDLMALSRIIPGVCYGMNKKEAEAELKQRLTKIFEERFDMLEISSFLKYLDQSK